MTKPERTPWTTALTDVDIIADTALVQGHPAYRSAKQGDLDAALQLFSEVMSDDQIAWWRERFGFGFEFLTEFEARYLLRAENADTIRNRLAAAEQESRA